jgi:hypothetical protein
MLLMKAGRTNSAMKLTPVKADFMKDGGELQNAGDRKTAAMIRTLV